MEKFSSSLRINHALSEMGIFSYEAVLAHLPYHYDDYKISENIKGEDKEKVVLFGRVASEISYKKTKKVTLTTFEFLTSDRHLYKIVCFNRPYLSTALKVNDEITLIGTYIRERKEVNLIRYIKGQIPENETIKPVYQLAKGLANYEYVRLVRKALETLKGKVCPLVPYDYRKKYDLIDKYNAYSYAHFPQDRGEIRKALLYLKYEEALLFSLKNLLIRNETKSLAKVRKEPIDLSLCESWLASLPFTLTGSQRNAASEIIEDMNQNTLMYRLLQGDVGTGKTLVSFIALYANYLRGDQGALMAPTDALARQHYENAKKLFKGTSLHIALLIGATAGNEKERIYQDLEDGTIDLVIGTHALFAKRVCYSSLGLVIIDEQHRFGVNQRLELLSKGDHADLLMMSATPIPRSLALTLFGDLDITTLTEFPNQIRSVTTRLLTSDDPLIFKSVDEALSQHKQVYIIAPLINYQEDKDYSVEQLYARYVLKYGKKVGLLHGKMKNEEKEKALMDFYSGITPILVSTQVVEVGIDVKNANTMVIYDATHFGLASLHQLRGRIGRDGTPATCLLTYDEEDEEETAKLHILTESIDGFKIAEEDMKTRGPGELTGLRQSGMPDFQYLNVINDYKIFTVARDDAKAIFIDKNNPHYQFLLKKAMSDIRKEPLTKG